MITLGIIGVVAAMTLPTVIANYQKKVAIVKLKKIYSLILNAEELSIIENGDPKFWDFDHSTKETAFEFFEKYYLNYINTKYVIKSSPLYPITNMNGIKHNWSGSNHQVEFPDGSCLWMFNNNQFTWLIYDINCSAPPNVTGKDVFDIFELYWWNKIDKDYLNCSENKCKNAQVPFLRNLKANPTLRDTYLDVQCKNYNGQGGAPSGCFAVILYDGFDFKKDYPWK